MAWRMTNGRSLIASQTGSENWNNILQSQLALAIDRSPRRGRELKFYSKNVCFSPIVIAPHARGENWNYCSETCQETQHKSFPTQGARIEIASKPCTTLGMQHRSPSRERELKSLSGSVLRCRANRSSRRGARIEIRISLRNHVFARRSLLTQGTRIEMLLHSFYTAKRLPRQARIEKSDGIEVESFPKGATIRCTFFAAATQNNQPAWMRAFFRA